MQPQLGTAEYTNSLIDKGNSLGLSLDQYRVPTGTPTTLPPATVPTSTKDIVSIGDFKLPGLTPSIGEPYAASASTLGIASGLSSGQQYLSSILPLLQAQYKTQETNKEGFLSKLISPKEAKTSALDELKSFGIQPLEQLKQLQEVSAEVTALQGQYDQLKLARDNELENIRTSAGGTTGGVTDSMTAAERNANFRLNNLAVQINARSSYAQALQGNYTQAMNFVEQAVNDAKNNNDFEYNLFQDSERRNSELFGNLASIYKEAWNFAKQDADMQRQEKNSRLDIISGLLKDMASAGAPASVYGQVASLLGKTDLSEQDIANAYKLAGQYSSGGSGGLSPYQIVQTRNQIEDNMRQNPAIQAYGQLVNFGVPDILKQYYSGTADSFSDTVLMRALAKVTDPSTGVREEEYRTFEDAQGALNRIYTVPKAWLGKGRLTTEGRSAIIREIESRFNSRQTDYLNSTQYYQNQAGDYGLSVPPPYQTVDIKSGSKDDESTFNDVVGGDSGYSSSSWLVNFWNNLF